MTAANPFHERATDIMATGLSLRLFALSLWHHGFRCLRDCRFPTFGRSSVQKPGGRINNVVSMRDLMEL